MLGVQVPPKEIIEMVKLADTLGLGSNPKLVRGSNPLFDMNKMYSLMVEQWTFNPKVLGSNPSTSI